MSIYQEGQSDRPEASTVANPLPNRSQRRHRAFRVTTAAAVALGLAVSGGAIANAASTGSPTSTSTPGAPGGPGGHSPFGGTPPTAMGTVASVGTNTFTLTTHDGTTVTVDVSSTTTYLDRGVTSPTLSDVKVGDHVAVVGTDSSNTVTATKVAIGGPNGPGGHGGPGGPGGHDGFGGTPPTAMGTVASVGTDTFTLTTHDGTTVTVDVSSATTYLDQGVTSPTLSDVKVGDHVAVFGTDSSNTVTATKVAIGGPGGHDGHGPFGGTPPAAMGTVASIGTNTFTLSTRDGTTVTVDVGSSTTYAEFGVNSASISDVKVGTHVAVFGTDSSNTVTATKVGIANPNGGPGGPGGPGDGDGDGGMPTSAPASSTGTSVTG